MSHFDPLVERRIQENTIDILLVEPRSKEDIRAARAYLGWTQPELAFRTNCNTGTINNLEKGKHIANKTLISKITRVFAKKGLKFSPHGGFLIKQDIVNIYEGEDCYLQLQEDIFDLVQPNDEILYLGSEDKKSTSQVIQNHKKLYDKGVYPKYMIDENDYFVQGPIEDYRQINSLFFVPINLTIIFKGKVAIDLYREGGQTKKIIVLNDSEMYNRMYKYFYSLWHKGTKLAHSQSKQLFFKKK